LSPLNNDSGSPDSTLNSYRIDLRYHGKPFQGWQSQPDGSGVQDYLQKALAVFLRHDVKVTGASRTDTGVHAQHQVATFRSAIPFDKRKWIKSLQGLLPETIGIAEIAPVPDSFHPILSSTQKIYRYLITTGISRNPFLNEFAWGVYQDLDVNSLEKDLAVLAGTHDFTSFCAADSGAKTRTRTIRETAVFFHEDLIEIWIRGEGFLKQMIRIIAGTAVHLNLDKLDLKSMTEVLAAKDRTVAGITAPGHGLALMHVSYEDQFTIPELRQKAGRGLTFFS
jgi:tRNA pseudouridine38-40 synthase